MSVPDDALDPLMSPDREYVAYMTKKHMLVVDGLQGTVYSVSAANVTFKKWLDSSTLLYFNRTSNLAAYVLQVNSKKCILVKTWTGLKWEVVHTYFSPYIELLYMELKDKSGYDHIYRYDATTGVAELPLGSIRISQIQYDSLTDTMKIHDIAGGTWTYANNQLTRPDGSVVPITTQKPNDNGKIIDYSSPNSKQMNHKDASGKKNKFEINSVNGK